jgi:hypothetical protein
MPRGIGAGVSASVSAPGSSVRADDPRNMPVESSPSPAGDPILSPGTRLQDLVVERWVRAVPDGHHYRVVHAATGRGATLHEYLPRAWAHREGGSVRALPGHEQDFELGLRRFTTKARQLKGLAHPSLPLLLDVWASHGTACALMSPLPAQTLAEVVAAQGGRLRLAQAWPWIRACFELAEWLHEQGRIHGAWDPDAIWVQEDQRLLMAAPEGDAGVRPPSPWVALEQSHPSPSGVRCGPWTDVFGIAAIAAFMLTGQTPSTARRLPLSAWMPPMPAGAASPGSARRPAGEPPPRALLAAIRVSLLPNPRQRPQDIQQLKAMMGLGTQPPVAGDRELASLPPDMPQTQFGEETQPQLDGSPPPWRQTLAPGDRTPAAPASLVVAPSRPQVAASPLPPAARTPPARSPFVAVLVGTALAVAGVAWVMTTRPDGAAPVAGTSGPPGADAIERLMRSSPPAAGRPAQGTAGVGSVVPGAAPVPPAPVPPAPAASVLPPTPPATAAPAPVPAAGSVPTPAAVPAPTPPALPARPAAAPPVPVPPASPASAPVPAPAPAPAPAPNAPSSPAVRSPGPAAPAAAGPRTAPSSAGPAVPGAATRPSVAPAVIARPAAAASAAPERALSGCSKSLLQQSLGGRAATDSKECP